MAIKIIVAAILLLQVTVQVSALDPYLFKFTRTTKLFEECEEELHTVQAEPYLIKSSMGLWARRFAAEYPKYIKWTEIVLLDPKSLLKCLYSVELITNSTTTMMMYNSGRCFRTGDPPYVLDEDPESCSQTPYETVYLITAAPST